MITQTARIIYNRGFIKKKGQRGYKYIVLGRDKPYLFKILANMYLKLTSSKCL